MGKWHFANHFAYAGFEKLPGIVFSYFL